MADTILDFDPGKLTKEQFDDFVKGALPSFQQPETPTLDNAQSTERRTADRGVLNVPPATADALSTAWKSLGVHIPDSYVSPEGQRMGMRAGTFLDTTHGASAGTRFQMGLDENRVNQFKHLLNAYGAGNVDLSEEGRFVLRNQPTPTGGKEDVLVDPHGFDAGDVAQLSSQILPMTLGVIGARFGLKFAGKEASGVSKAIWASVGMALAQEGTGAAQDAFVRLLRGDTVSASEIAKKRTMMALVDAPLGVAAAGVAKATSVAVEGILGLDGLDAAAGPALGMKLSKTQKAAQELQEQTKVSYPLSPAQAAGPGTAAGKLMLREEAAAGARTGSAGAMDKIVTAQKSAEDELKRVFMDLPRTMSDEELAAALPRADVVGEQTLRQLSTEATALKTGVRTAKSELAATGTAETEALGRVDLRNPINSTSLGGELRTKAVTEYKATHADFGQRYDDFLSKPEIQARTVKGDSIAKAADAVGKKYVPAADKAELIPSFDAYGSPTAISTTQTQPLNAFVEGKFKGFLAELKGLEGATVGVNDLKRINTAIKNSIKEGIAIPGTDTSQLNALHKVVDEGITQALADMPDKSLLTTWEGLKNGYSAFQDRFNRVGIREMLVTPGERGAIGDTALAESALGNTKAAKDNYDGLKAFFGETSPEFQKIQQNIREKTLFGSRDEIQQQFVDGAKLRAKLRDIRPEISEEVFGASSGQMHEIGEILKQARTLDINELSELAKTGSLTATKIKALIDAENLRAVAFNNKLIKAADSGMWDAEVIRPSEIVRYGSQMDYKEAQKVLGVLSDRPDLIQSIKQLSIEHLWSRSVAGSENGLVSSRLIRNALQGADSARAPAQEATWRAWIGDDAVNGLLKLADTVEARDFTTSAFSGKLGAQSDAARLMSGKAATILPEVAHRFLLGFLYAGPLKRSVTNMLVSQDRGRFLNAVIASTPFVENVMSRFGTDTGLQMMQTYRDMVQPIQRREMNVQGQLRDKDFNPGELSGPEFEEWLKHLQQ